MTTTTTIMKTKRERRAFHVDLRADGDDQSKKIVGYAAVFNSSSQDLGGFTEIIRKGAFAKTIQESDVRALWNHNDDVVLGRTKSGTLTLSEDDQGLRIEIDPPDTQAARDLMALIGRGDIDQMSFAFRAVRDAYTKRGDGSILRELLEVRLYDVSPVTYPAYEETTVNLRSLIEGRDLTDEEKDVLQDVIEPVDEEAAPPLAGHPVSSRARAVAIVESLI